MKSWKTRGVMTVFALALTVSVSGCMSQAAGPGETIEKRKALMKKNGGYMKQIGGFVKAGKGSAADVALAGQGISASAKAMSGLFPKGTSTADGVGKTRAKPEIWMQRAKFDAATTNLAALADKLTAAAGTGNKKAIAVAMGNLGKKGCGGCHGAFRAKKK